MVAGSAGGEPHVSDVGVALECAEHAAKVEERSGEDSVVLAYQGELAATELQSCLHGEGEAVVRVKGLDEEASIRVLASQIGQVLQIQGLNGRSDDASLELKSVSHDVSVAEDDDGGVVVHEVLDQRQTGDEVVHEHSGRVRERGGCHDDHRYVCRAIFRTRGAIPHGHRVGWWLPLPPLHATGTPTTYKPTSKCCCVRSCC